MTKLRQTTLVLGMAVATLTAMDSAHAQEAPEAAAAAEVEEKSAWERSAALGFTLTEGNSETLLFTANVDASTQWEQNEFAAGAGVQYGENEGERTTQTATAFGQYNRLFSERLFGLARLSLLHDDIADIEYRLTFSPGIGYYFIKEPKTTFRGEAGPAFIYEKQGEEETGYFTLRLAERFEHKFSKRAKVWQFAEFLPQVDNFDNYIINAEVGAEAALTESVNLRVLIQDTYDNEPAPGRKENDVKIITSVAMTF